MVCSAKNEVVFGLYLHSALVPCDFMLVLQWCTATLFFMVDYKFHLYGCDVCCWRIFVYENRVKSYTHYQPPKG